MHDNIRITGTLASTVAISPEQFACIPIILADHGLEYCTTTTAGHPETVRIEFDFTGVRTRERNNRNLVFLESVLRVADTCEEINLGLVGEVLIEDVPGPKVFKEVRMIEISDGRGKQALGRITETGYEWSFSGVEVPLTPKPLNFG